MKFTTIPNAFASWNESLLYTLHSESEEPQDATVEVYDAATNTLVGTKFLRAITSATFDIAPMLRRRMHITLPEVVTTTRPMSYNASAEIYLKVGELTSEHRIFVAAQLTSNTPCVVLSEQIDSRTLAPDECDMVGFVTTFSGCYARIRTYGKDNATRNITFDSPGQYILTILPLTLGDCDQIEVEFCYSTTVFRKIEYSVKRNLKGARRIGWLNKDYAPEIYTFPMRKSILIKATRKHMESSMGRGAGEVEADGELKLISAYEPSAQLTALAKIVGSPAVWLMEGARRRNVDLITDRVILTPSDRLGFVEIDIRGAKEGEEL